MSGFGFPGTGRCGLVLAGLLVVALLAMVAPAGVAADDILSPGDSITGNIFNQGPACNGYPGPWNRVNTGFNWTIPSGQPGVAVPDSTVADPFAAIDEKLAPDEAAALRALIQNTLHAFSYNEATGAWYARNAENRITVVYTKDGRAEFSGPEHSFGLTLSGVGREGATVPAPAGTAGATGRQLNITRPGFTEWYRNHDEGVEQGVTVMSRPAGSGPLLVRFAIVGNSTFSTGTGQALTMTDSAGSPLFTYTGLHAYGADGREIPASLATDGSTLSWIVDDAGAVYPVTVDPVVASASNAAAAFTGGAAGDSFGSPVALSSDGSRALVGAYSNDTAASAAGAAYLFVKPAGGWSGTTSASAATATFTGGAADDYFGISTALSSDGSRALVGAPYNDTAASAAGAAYLFVEPAGGWSGTTSASAATATFTGGAANDGFGYPVSLSSDGSRVLVGAGGNNTAASAAGAAYLFAEPAGGWTGTTSASAATATFTGGAAGDSFHIVSLSSDGSRALVGASGNDTAASGAGAAYLFAEPAGGWSGTTSASAATATFTGGAAYDRFGISTALSSDGSRALVGASGNNTAGLEAGAVYLFAEPAGGWTGTTPASAATATFTGGNALDNFGSPVALSSDGSRALVGVSLNDTAAWGAGAAYLFAEPAGGWTGTTSASAATATFTGGAADDYFGNSVSLSSDGSLALVGAYRNDTAGSIAGAAYIFRPPYVTLTAGGTTTGITGTTADGLTLNPDGTLTNVDLYLGTGPTAVTGTPVRTGIASLPASMGTTVDGLDLTGTTPGTYYLIACESGTTIVLGATATAAYTVILPAPAISGITPPTGMNTSGVSVTDLAGTDFDTTTLPAVKLNRTGYADIVATGIATPSSSQIACTFPITGAEAGPWNVVVTNPDGQEAMLANGFTITAPNIIPPPAVTGITPNTGLNTTGISITNLAGSNFNTTFIPVVRLNRTGYADIVATGVATPSSSQITCTLPITGAETGPWNVVVTNTDGQEAMLANGFTITAPVPTPVPTTTPAAGPLPTYDQYNTGSGNSDFPSSSLPLMTVTVNIGGDSKAWQAIVTGTKLSGLIVTGTEQYGSGSNLTAPPGIVYQYFTLVPARYDTITKAVINFTVPQSWLDEHHIAPKSIVLYRQTLKGWETLPTTVLYTKDGKVYFSAESTGFSLFAIAGTPAAVTQAITTAATFGSVVEEQATTRAIATKPPVTTQTTAPPAATPKPVAPSPLLNIVLVIAAIGILAGGGFMVRRWWIHRQNPALFREHD